MLRTLPIHRADSSEVSLDRVVCASEAAPCPSMFGRLEEFRAEALRHNVPRGLHAALIYQSGWYVYWSEGPAPALRAHIGRLRQDPRHVRVQVLHHSQGHRHLATPWSMMLSPSTEPGLLLARRIESARGLYRQGSQVSAPSTVRRIIAPMRLGTQDASADPEAFHRIGVCAAAGDEAFRLVEWLARQHGMRVHSRRFAGEHDHDGGSDYVEWMRGEHPCRVIAVARSGLLHGMRRAFLPDWPYVLLLFSGRATYDDALMDRVRVACNGLPRRPTLLGVAADAATLLRMAEAATLDGLRFIPSEVGNAADPAAAWALVSEQLDRDGPPQQSVWGLADSALE